MRAPNTRLYSCEGAPDISAPIDAAVVLQRYLNAAVQAPSDTGRIVAQSRMLRAKSQAEIEQIVGRSRAPMNVRSGSSELLSPRRRRSLYVQAQDECQRFLRVATALTKVIEDCAATVTNSVHLVVRARNHGSTRTTDLGLTPLLPQSHPPDEAGILAIAGFHHQSELEISEASSRA